MIAENKTGSFAPKKLVRSRAPRPQTMQDLDFATWYGQVVYEYKAFTTHQPPLNYNFRAAYHQAFTAREIAQEVYHVYGREIDKQRRSVCPPPPQTQNQDQKPSF